MAANPGPRWITFTSDFGLSDAYVGICHGVLGRIAPTARIIDVTHGVPAGSIAVGAHLLASAVGYLPAAVHLAVVDPGVGTGRRAIVLAAGDSLLVGPDNGLLVPAAQQLGGIAAAHLITEERYWLRPVSATFHGRDIFAPAAAHLAAGTTPPQLGPPLDPATLTRLPSSTVRMTDSSAEGKIAHVDTYGNLILTIPATVLPTMQPSGRLAVEVGTENRSSWASLGTTFADVPPGRMVVHGDSTGLVAIAINQGSAQRAFGNIPVGASIRLTWSRSEAEQIE